MTILDSYAVIAFLRAEPAAEQVRELLASDATAVTAVGLAEIVDQLVRVGQADEDDVFLDLAQLDLLDALPVIAATGAAAGRLRARRYHRTRCAISMADCVAAETARIAGRPLATSDPHLLDVCHLEDIASIPLPDTTGAVWTPPASA